MKNKAMLLHHNMIDSVMILSDEECGKLFKALFLYDVCGFDPEFEDIALRIVFAQFKNALDSNRERYESICNKRSENAKKRWEKIRNSNNDADEEADENEDEAE